MISWNKNLYEKNKQELEEKANIILTIDLKNISTKPLPNSINWFLISLKLK